MQMTPRNLARFVALVIAYYGIVHAVVWGLSALMADLGEAPGLSWPAWWTREGLSVSVVLQTRVGLVVALIALVLRKAVFRSPQPGRGRVGVLFTGICTLAAVVVEAVLLSGGHLGSGRAEIVGILGPSAHNMLTIGAAVAASQWADYHFRAQPTISDDVPALAR